jgi:hypothetical protein
MKGLSFSEPMVKSWMEGRKILARRLISGIDPSFFIRERQSAKSLYLFTKMSPDEQNHNGEIGIYSDRWIKPRYLPGETVYIKETWATPVDDPDTKEPGLISYPASELLLKGHWKIKSPRFMPEWASRSHALIVSVRPERVREITEEDAVREGVTPSIVGHDLDYLRYRAGFQTIWESLHPGSWEKNEWCWVYTLKKLD